MIANAMDISLWPADDFCVVGNDIYFFHGTLNCLLQYNMETHSVKYLGVIEGEKAVQEKLFCRIFFYDNKLFLFPYYASKVVVYDFNTEQYRTICDGENYKFRDAFADDDFVYAINEKGSEVIKFALKDEAFREKYDLKGTVPISFEGTLCGKVTCYDEIVLIPIYSYSDNINFFIIFDKKEKKFKWIKTDAEANGFYVAFMYDEKIYTQCIGNLVFYEIDYHTGKIQREIHKFNNTMYVLGECDGRLLIGVEKGNTPTEYERNEYIWYTPETGEFSEFEYKYDQKDRSYFKYPFSFGPYKKTKDGFIFYDEYHGCIVEKKGMDIVMHKPVLSADDRNKVYENIRKGGLSEVYYESDGWDLNLLMYLLD